LARAAFDRGFDQRMQRGFVSGEVFREEWAGEFDRQKLMSLGRGTFGGQRFTGAMIKAHGARREFRARPVALNEAVAFQVQAKLDAARVKTRGPIQFVARKKIVPLDAESESVKISKQRLPSAPDISPGWCLAKKISIASGFISRTFHWRGLWVNAHRAGTIGLECTDFRPEMPS
jgi:hypothetical protein